MPISPLVLQRRHAELGRIRLGHKTGSGRGRPAKLETFRFTSPSESYIRDLAELYGGEAQQWDNNGKAEFEVFTTAKTIQVIAVKGGMSQWMETWSGGGCTHRCDGEINALTGDPCDPQDRDHLAARPTTRLSVMLPELEAVGVWRLESHGWNAAAELPAVAELALFVGDLVPAHLHLVERRAIKDGKTSRFVVPVLDLAIGVDRLRAIAAERSGMAPALGGAGSMSGAPALTAGPAGDVADPFAPLFEQIAAATSFEECQQIWATAQAAGLVGQQSQPSPRRDEFWTALKARSEQLQAGPATAAPQQGEAPVEGVVVEQQGQQWPPTEADPDVVWQQILGVGGDLGLTLQQVAGDFTAVMGMAPGQASGGELQAYLDAVRANGFTTVDTAAVPA